MGGFFGVVSRRECVNDLFYGTDYHSHLGTRRAGMAVFGDRGFRKIIHDISNAQFRSKFEEQLGEFHGRAGIGVISDFEDQPLLVASHHGTYAIATVSFIANAEEITRELFAMQRGHFSSTTYLGINPTELISAIIDTQPTLLAGLMRVQEIVKGSCSLLLLTDKGEIVVMRDRWGRTPVVIARDCDGYAAAMESTAFANLGYSVVRDLGPGEIVSISADGERILSLPRPEMRICAFFWIYFGFPSSKYEGINVEEMRYKNGEALAKRSPADVDIVTGVPDSGVAHALGFSHATGIPYKRPFVKYTPTWPRSFMPPDQTRRQLIANKKLIAIPDFIQGKRIACLDDSIVRGTQLRDQAHRLYDNGASEVHMRVACPPLLFGCRFLNFSRSSSENELIARRTAIEIDGPNANMESFVNPDCEKHCLMVERIRARLGLTSLKFQRLDDMLSALGLPENRVCTYCWNGNDPSLRAKCPGCAE